MRLGTYSARYGILPPAAMVATRAQAADPRAVPRYGERIPYVVVYGEPGARSYSDRSLIASCADVHALLDFYLTIMCRT